MFKEKINQQPLKEVQNPETIIGSSMRVDGNFKGDGDIIIDGTVIGSIKTKKDINIGEQANVKADIEAENAIIAGNIKGNIVIKKQLDLTPTAYITGDIIVKNIFIDIGARINGKITMDLAEDDKKNNKSAKEYDSNNASVKGLD